MCVEFWESFDRMLIILYFYNRFWKKLFIFRDKIFCFEMTDSLLNNVDMSGQHYIQLSMREDILYSI